MPLPSGADQHVDSLLTEMLVQFTQDEGSFIAPRAFPVINSQSQTGKYAIYDRGDFLRDEAQKRAPGDESAGGGYRTSMGTYLCEEYAFHKDVADQERSQATNPFNPDRDAMTYLTQKRLLKEEVAWATENFATGVWGTDVTGGTDFDQWDDVASDVIGIFDTYSETIEAATGFYPNFAVMNRRGWKGLKNHPDIVDRVKHTSPGPVTPELVAQLLGLDEILIAKTVRNTAAEGATTSVSYIFGNHCLLGYRTPTPSTDVPSCGYTVRWTSVEGGNNGAAVSTIRIPTRKVDRHEVDFGFDHIQSSTALAVFMSSVVSA